jgi:hypothetical protein
MTAILYGHAEWLKSTTLVKKNFDSHLKTIKATPVSVPYVCIGSHAFAMFAHKFFLLMHGVR